MDVGNGRGFAVRLFSVRLNHRRPILAALIGALAIAAMPAPSRAGATSGGPGVQVLTSAARGAESAVADIVPSGGGTIDPQRRIIEGFSATVPAGAVGR